MTTIVIMPGGFHPFHAGHAALYQSAQRAFPDAEVFVAATNDTSSRPFPFAVKEKLAKLAGVEAGHFVQVKSPFRAEEITAGFDPARDTLIFVRSEKDSTKPPQPGGVKKDGSPAYLQPLLGAKRLEPFAKHAYMAYLPTVEFGPGMTSATEIRSAWPQLNDKRKTALVMSLYPRTQGNVKLAATVVGLLDAAIGSEQGVAEAATGSFNYDQISAMPMKDRLALYKTNPELKNLYNAEFQKRVDAKLNNYTWMTPQEKAEYERLSTLDAGKDLDTKSYAAEKYLKQLFQQKMDTKKAASMLKVHWAPSKQLESFLQGKVNNKIELSAYLAPNTESLGKTRWTGATDPTVGIVLDGHITIGGREDLGSDQYKMTAGQRGQQKYTSRPGQIDPTLSMDTSAHHEVLIDNWKIKEIVLPADIPPEVDRLVQQYKIPVRRLGNPQGVAEAFDKPYRSKTEKSESGSFDVLAKLPDGTNLSIMFNNNGNDEWQVEFYRNNSQEVTGEGDAQRIFATVLNAIQKFITKHKPAHLTFAASKETDPSVYYEPGQPQPNPESRAKLYDRLVQRYAKAWGYRAFRADNGHIVMYELSRINKPGVAEGAPIVVALAPIDVRNPKKAQQPQRYMGDIVPPTKPPSTEKRGVKGRPGQRPMPGVAEAAKKCPPATQDIGINLENRQKAIDEYGYGPLNPDLPNTKFWMKKVSEWNLDSMEEAQQSLCGNCAAFDVRQDTLDCIAQGIDSESPEDAEGVIDAGDLGYCKFLKFKCASRRTCDAWVTGGPLADKPVEENQGWAATYNESDDYIEEKWSAKYKSSINCANPQGFSQKAHCAGRKK